MDQPLAVLQTEIALRGGLQAVIPRSLCVAHRAAHIEGARDEENEEHHHGLRRGIAEFELLKPVEVDRGRQHLRRMSRPPPVMT